MNNFSIQTGEVNIANQPGGVVPFQLRPVDQQISGGVPTVQRSRALEYAAQVANNILAPQIKAQLDKQMLSGMVAAASGITQEEIAATQPEWSRAFGPTAAEQGGSMYRAQAQVLDWSAKAYSAIENEDFALTPEEYGQSLLEQGAAFRSGDAARDTQSMQSVMGEVPVLVRKYTKARSAYHQKEAEEAQGALYEAGAARYARLARDPQATPEDREGAANDLLGRIQPFINQNDESFERNISKTVKNAVASGDLELVRLFKDTKDVGEDGVEVSIWDSLPAALRADVEPRLPAAARKALNQTIPKYAIEAAKITLDPTRPVADTLEMMTAFNEKVRMETGIREADYFPPESFDSVANSNLTARRSMAEQAARERASAAKAAGRERESKLLAIEEAQRKEAVLFEDSKRPGGIGDRIRSGDATAAEGARVASNVWLSEPTPEGRAAILTRNADIIIPAAQAAFRTGLADPNFGPSQRALVAQYAALEARGAAGQTLIGKYFGDSDATAPIQAVLTAIRGGSDNLDVIWKDRELLGRTRANAVNLDKDDTITTAISDYIDQIHEEDDDNLIPFNTPESLSDNGQRTLAAMIHREYKRLRDSSALTATSAVARAAGLAEAGGLERIGSEYSLGRTSQQEPLALKIPGKKNEAGNALDKRIKANLAKYTKDVAAMSVIRQPDTPEGEAMFFVQAFNKAGQTFEFTIDTSGVRKDIAAQRKKDSRTFGDTLSDLAGLNAAPSF
jgi:hypothetical protein